MLDSTRSLTKWHSFASVSVHMRPDIRRLPGVPSAIKLLTHVAQRHEVRRTQMVCHRARNWKPTRFKTSLLGSASKCRATVVEVIDDDHSQRITMMVVCDARTETPKRNRQCPDMVQREKVAVCRMQLVSFILLDTDLLWLRPTTKL